ncbi:MAG: cupin domain-containing protein [Deltaproteobacteria bacterium]|jgi:mannose-6-phosphate isomerase-like protein (cupin superfamily)|nr:cupin domain-containing protein [Deltaproteobacteria bacterium]
MLIESFPYQEHIRYNDAKAEKTILAKTAHTQTTLWCLKPAQKISPHVHAGDHVWVVLEGEGRFLSEASDGIHVKAGSILSAPAGLSHGIENTGSLGLVFISVSAG